MVELHGISKYFPSNGVTALENAGLTLKAGEIHALLGENGTGKSTLMHILGGYLSPSSGSIIIDGKEQKFAAPADALARGIGMVRQHPGFIRGFTVWEDCILGAEKSVAKQKTGMDYDPGNCSENNNKKDTGSIFRKSHSPFLESGFLKKRVQELIGQWGFDLSPDQSTESLTVSQRQQAAVLALLLRNVKWYIFDEPTAVLAPNESENLIKLFERLRGEGKGIILITHKLEEALEIADRITVIRKGKTGESRNARDLSLDILEKMIFGTGDTTHVQNDDKKDDVRKNDGKNDGEKKDDSKKEGDKEDAILEIRDLQLELPGMPHLQSINLRLMPGQIIGITGTRDSGLETLELVVAGLLKLPGKSPEKKPDGSPEKKPGGNPENRSFKIEGSITLNGRNITGKGVRAFRDAGGSYLGADRLGVNLAPDLPIRESLMIHAYRKARRCFGIFLDMGYINSWCREIMNRSGISRPLSDNAVSFSGGMLQRILLAREFAEDASLMVLAEAGSGLDQLNRLKVAKELKAQVRHSVYAPRSSALLFSTDMDELISVADEIMVLRNGTLAVLENNEK